MPRNRRLKGIAQGLLDSFVSRNNDIGGYWGIGVLRREVDPGSGLPATVVLDLLSTRTQPASPSTCHARDAYALRLTEALTREGIAMDALSVAKIVVRFEATQAATVFGTGELVACHVRLTDSRGREYAARGDTACVAHDPGRETGRRQPA